MRLLKFNQKLTRPESELHDMAMQPQESIVEFDHSCGLEESQVCTCDHSLKNSARSVKSAQTSNGDIHKADSTFFQAVINMVGMLVGLGQLSTPYALESGGWASAFLLIALGAICAYTAHLLGRCLHKNPKSRNFADIAGHAFGQKGKIIAITFIYLEIFMALVSYTISLHDNLFTVFSKTHFNFPLMHMSTSQTLTIIAVLIAIPSMWLRDLSSISFLSSVGVLMSCLIFGMVACTALFGRVEADQYIPVLRLQKIPAISGLYAFSFGGHIVFPELYKGMKDPTKFTKVCVVSFAVATSLYTSIAFMGAKMFGPTLSSQITLSMPQHLLFTKIALWATVVTPMTKYALEFAPIAMQLERHLPHSMNSKTRLIITGTIGSIILIFILGLALSVPFFEHVLGLTGSLVSISICIVFPCTFYTKITWDHISKPALTLNIFLVLSGCLIGVFGTYSSSKAIINSFISVHSLQAHTTELTR
uniref:Amino acid transporter transmembrane domain-containing protein n=1 Tax=Kalanchoe fedtschenkoi TaxID=63787 RepID=A0A7N0TT92_KALFE